MIDIEIQIAPEIQAELESLGLNHFDAFMKFCDGEILERTVRYKKTEVWRFKLPRQTVYLKRTLQEPFNRILRTLVSGVKPHVACVREKQLVQLLIEQGFEVMPVLAWGEKRIFGIPTQGFLLVGEVAGQALKDQFEKADQEERLQLLRKMGQLLGRLHANGFFHKLRFQDVIVSKEQLVMIDRGTFKPWSSRFSIQKSRKALMSAYDHFKRSGCDFTGKKEFLTLLREYRRSLAEEKSLTQLIQNPADLPADQLLKRATRRLIFKHVFCGSTVVVKAFPLQLLRHKLKYKKYAYAEAANLTKAKALGLPVPKVLGYKEHRRWGLVQWNAVLMEYFAYPTLGQCLQQTSDETLQWQYLLRTLPLFKKFYQAGCNHLDFKPDSILVSSDERSDVLIDFQYVVFLSNPNPEVLVMQVAHFAWEASIRHSYVSEELIKAWFEALLSHLDFPQDQRLWRIFNSARVQKTSLQKRMHAFSISPLSSNPQ